MRIALVVSLSALIFLAILCLKGGIQMTRNVSEDNQSLHHCQSEKRECSK